MQWAICMEVVAFLVCVTNISKLWMYGVCIMCIAPLFPKAFEVFYSTWAEVFAGTDHKKATLHYGTDHMLHKYRTTILIPDSSRQKLGKD